MPVIRGVYDGKTIRPLSTEFLPEVEGEVLVEIVFPDGAVETEGALLRRKEAADRLIAARNRTPPLDESVKELIEDGRYR